MIEISGTTRIFPVIGWPVEPVKTPTLFNAYFKRHDIDARVIPLKIGPSKYIEAVRVLMAVENVGGIFVSVPHKPMSVDAVDIPSPRAMLAGACNAIYRGPDGATIVGDLVEGEGFIRALERTIGETPFPWATAKALVVGSGAVGCAVAEVLAARAIGQVAICDTCAELAEALRARLQMAFSETEIVIGAPRAEGCDLVVNATPLGMAPGDAVPVDLDGLSPSCIVADCGMEIEMTRLLVEAQARGCRIQTGKEMMIEQSPLYLELFGFPSVPSDAFRELGVL